MSLVATIADQWSDGKRLHVIGDLAFSGNYVTSGDTVNFATSGVESSQPPELLIVAPLAGNVFIPVYGTDVTNSKVMAYDKDGVQFTGAAAYPAGVTGVSSKFYAIFPQLT